MRETLTQKSDGFMPRSIAITLLTSNQSKTNSFRKRCFRAMARVCEPVSRSTQLDISAPKTGEQKLQARLNKANAAQLHKWAKRTLARGNRYQDLLLDTQEKLTDAPAEDMNTLWAAEKALLQQIAAHDGLCEAINAELALRATRGIGYRKPIKFIKT